jgi:hypothetical protein
MSHNISAMLNAHPQKDAVLNKDKTAECIAACFECAQTCTGCADACLGEDMVTDLATCIRTDLDCADVCAATGKILTRQTGGQTSITLAALEACRSACSTCAEECEKHAGMHEHCRICAEACRRCEAACGVLLAAG